MDWPKIQLPPSKLASAGELDQQKGTMYGMLLESVQHFVQRLHGNEAWHQITQVAGVQNVVFTTHGRYSDSIIIRLSSACAEVMRDRTKEEYMCFFGQCFVEYCSHYGYDKIMRISGRHYRDFLRGIDNLHETMRFSYPKMMNPSLYVESEDSSGCVLHYRSRRVGFTHYVIGQLTQFATLFYNVRVDIDVLREETSSKGCHVIYRLNFDNAVYKESRPSPETKLHMEFAPIPQSTFFKIFPFCMVMNSDLVVTQTGSSLPLLFEADIVGRPVCESFVIRRPRMEFSFENVMCRQTVMFELEVRNELRSKPKAGKTSSSTSWNTSHPPSEHTSNNGDVLLLKGQMKHIPELDGIAFLCTPLLGNLDDLDKLGLKINDLSMYDFSRDMVLRGWQHSSALEYTIEKQVKKSEQIGENLQELDEWKSRSEQLLYAMIPQSVAEKLKNGEDPINTCKIVESVTIMFCYLVGFTELCTSLPALQCIETINFIFSEFDRVVDDFGIFKVETLGDAVYMAAGGVPDATSDHGVRVAGVALTLRELVKDEVKRPFPGSNFNIRVGLHTGGVVAGVVGKRTPQYCLFGDTVNTASRMQTYSQPGEIHLSETSQQQLHGKGFVTKLRGTMDIKGKGSMKTYWLVGQEGQTITRPQTDTYLEFEQTADQPTRIRTSQHIPGKGGFTMETTVTCHPARTEDYDDLEDEPDVDLDQPECPVTTNVPPKISVEDFKFFMSMRSTSKASGNMADIPLTCPFSGMALNNTVLQEMGVNMQNGDARKDLQLQDSVDEDTIEDQSSSKNSLADHDIQGVADSRRRGSIDERPTVGLGRTSRRKSFSGLMLLDEFRTSIDGAASRLSKDYRKYHKYNAQMPKTPLVSGLSRSLSPSSGASHSRPSSPSWSEQREQLMLLNDMRKEQVGSTTLPQSEQCSIMPTAPRSRQHEQVVLLTDLNEEQVSPSTTPTQLSASYKQAAHFWQQREQCALQETQQLRSSRLSSSPAQKLLNGYQPLDTESPTPSSPRALHGSLRSCASEPALENPQKKQSNGLISTPGMDSDDQENEIGVFHMDE